MVENTDFDCTRLDSAADVHSSVVVAHIPVVVVHILATAAGHHSYRNYHQLGMALDLSIADRKDFVRNYSHPSVPLFREVFLFELRERNRNPR